jgi:hypothetical protein
MSSAAARMRLLQVRLPDVCFAPESGHQKSFLLSYRLSTAHTSKTLYSFL